MCHVSILSTFFPPPVLRERPFHWGQWNGCTRVAGYVRTLSYKKTDINESMILDEVTISAAHFFPNVTESTTCTGIWLPSKPSPSVSRSFLTPLYTLPIIRPLSPFRLTRPNGRTLAVYGILRHGNSVVADLCFMLCRTD
jgi:hypothetical protein